MTKKIIGVLFLFFISTLCLGTVEHSLSGHPVLVQQDTLITYYVPFGSFTPAERSHSSTAKILEIIDLGEENLQISVHKNDLYAELLIGNKSIFTVTNEDAEYLGVSRDSLVSVCQINIENFLRKDKNDVFLLISLGKVIKALLILIVTFSLIFVIIKFNNRLESFLSKLINRLEYQVKVLPKFSVDLKKVFTTLLFFFNGFKLILIAYLLIQSVLFLLKHSQNDYYWYAKLVFASIFKTITLTIITFYIVKLFKDIINNLHLYLHHKKDRLLDKMHYQSLSFISEDRFIEFISMFIKSIYYIMLLIILYFYLTLLFSFYSLTKTWTIILFNFISTPIKSTFFAIINYLPNIFTILVIFFLLKYALKIIKLFFSAIRHEKLKFRNFYKDWAQPTYLIVRFLIIVFGAIVLFPYLPGSSSPFFQGISVFLGIIFSFGSSSAIANIISGVVLTYMRPFHIGDIVKISDTQGRVVEKSLLVTRIRTIKNIEISIPNSIILNSHITNYSALAKDSGLILHVEVTFGFDVEWEKVYELLVQAALATDLVCSEPEPFVLHKNLGNNYVHYELNVFTHAPTRIPFIYSDLNRNIVITFNKAGIELLMPTYFAIRDGNQPAIPDCFKTPDEPQTGFKIDFLSKLFK